MFYGKEFQILKRLLELKLLAQGYSAKDVEAVCTYWSQ